MRHWALDFAPLGHRELSEVPLTMALAAVVGSSLAWSGSFIFGRPASLAAPVFLGRAAGLRASFLQNSGWGILAGFNFRIRIHPEIDLFFMEVDFVDLDFDKVTHG